MERRSLYLRKSTRSTARLGDYLYRGHKGTWENMEGGFRLE